MKDISTGWALRALARNYGKEAAQALGSLADLAEYEYMEFIAQWMADPYTERLTLEMMATFMTTSRQSVGLVIKKLTDEDLVYRSADRSYLLTAKGEDAVAECRELLRGCESRLIGLITPATAQETVDAYLAVRAEGV